MQERAILGKGRLASPVNSGPQLLMILGSTFLGWLEPSTGGANQVDLRRLCDR
jgi:hypothetical protein